MARYINADKLEETLYKMDDGENECLTPMEFKDYILDFQPTEDVAPVIHAHWEEDGNETYCSRCGQSIDTYYHLIDIDDFDYCFGCGAKMDEKENNND